LCLFLAVLLYYTLRFVWEFIPLTDLRKRAVLITGCDTGFGQLLAIRLASNGILVYAGCLTIEGQNSLLKKGEKLNISERLISLLLDVTSDVSVEKSAQFVKDALPKNIFFWALVNNAGIFSCYGPDAWTSLDEYRKSIDVNLFGMIRCVHAFLPLLKQNKGRIISIASVAGRMSFPGGAPYTIAKYGVEAYMDAIRLELNVFGIKCCILEPGAFRTNLLDAEQMRDRVNSVWNKLSTEMKAEYGNEYKDKFVNGWNSTLKVNASTRYDYVVDNYFHAVTARYPRLRYRCGWDAVLLFIPLSFMPTEISDAVFKILAMRNPAIPAIIKRNKIL